MQLKEVGYTHFIYNHDEGSAQVMDLDECEECGHISQGAKVATVYQPLDYLHDNGLIALGAQPGSKCACV